VTSEYLTALILAGGLALFACFSLWRQYRKWRALRSETHIASDDRRFRIRQIRRRSFCGVLILTAASLLGGSFLLGIEKRAHDLGEQRAALREQARAENPENPAEIPPMNDEEKDFVRFYSGVWIAQFGLWFLIIATAIVDFWATRRYAFEQYRQISDDHNARLRRDLALYRQNQQQRR
jgi:hypothetical protein